MPPNNSQHNENALSFTMVISSSIETPRHFRLKVPSMAIVDRYTSLLIKLPRPDKFRYLLSILYSWPSLATEIIHNMRFRKKIIANMAAKMAAKKFRAKKKLKALLKKAAMGEAKAEAKKEAKKRAIVGKHGKTLTELFWHSSSRPKA